MCESRPLAIYGRVAQLVEHYLDMVVVAGSSPVVATIYNFKTPNQFSFALLCISCNDDL